MAKFLLDSGYTTGEFGKNHLGDHTASIPTAHGFQEYWDISTISTPYNRLASPINSTPTVQGIAASVPQHAGPRSPRCPLGSWTRTTTCLTPPPGDLVQVLRRNREKPELQRPGPLTLERSKTMDEEISARVVYFLDRN